MIHFLSHVSYWWKKATGTEMGHHSETITSGFATTILNTRILGGNRFG